MSYQTILDAVRRYRCEESLADDWVPGKCLAWDLGYAEVNSFIAHSADGPEGTTAT